MAGMIELTELTADDWRMWRELRLEALREAPYAFGSTLEQWQGDGDREERWRERLADVAFNIAARLDGVAAGMVSAAGPNVDGTTELISMWVAPFARGRGVGDALIEAVTRWSAQRGVSLVLLAVREENSHAIALYRRHGFVDGAQCAVDDDGPRERVMMYSLPPN